MGSIYMNDPANNQLIPVVKEMVGATGSTVGIGGLVPTPQAGDENKVLKGDGTWGDFTSNDMIGATATTDGTHGLIKQPHAGDQNKFFRGDGTWANVIDTIYPINSVYISMVDVNPGTFWTGTTWDKLSDGYLRNNATDATGGSLTSGETVLTADQIPSHSHTFTTGSGGAHTHTATTGSYGAHTHTAKTGSYGAHTHALQLKDGRFSNEYKHLSEVIAGGSVSRAFVEYWSASNNNILIAGSAGAHTHTLTTGSYGAHTHTLTTGSYGSHTHTGTTEAKGGGQGHTHSIEPPYVRIYAFKRTA